MLLKPIQMKINNAKVITWLLCCLEEVIKQPTGKFPKKMLCRFKCCYWNICKDYFVHFVNLNGINIEMFSYLPLSIKITTY